MAVDGKISRPGTAIGGRCGCGGHRPAAVHFVPERVGSLGKRSDRRRDHRLRAEERATGDRERRAGKTARSRPDRGGGRFQHETRRRVGATMGPSLTRTTAQLLDRKDVEVVVYATPEHWHYLPCIHACQAGKDMYGEQPLSHTIREGRI